MTRKGFVLITAIFAMLVITVYQTEDNNNGDKNGAVS